MDFSTASNKHLPNIHTPKINLMMKKDEKQLRREAILESLRGNSMMDQKYHN